MKLFVALLIVLSSVGVVVAIPDISVSVNAYEDSPGPVHILATTTDNKGIQTLHLLKYTSETGQFSEKSFAAPKNIRTIRLQFVNDYNDSVTDRNAYIDYLAVNGRVYQAEAYSSTGSGSEQCTTDLIAGTSVALCATQDSWIEFNLHPGNPPGNNGNPNI